MLVRVQDAGQSRVGSLGLSGDELEKIHQDSCQYTVYIQIYVVYIFFCASYTAS